MHHHNQRGQAVIEAALVSLVLLVTLIAIFDMGQIFFIRQSLNERVRNAARWGAVHTYDAGAIRNMVLYNQPGASGRAGSFGLTADMVSVTRAGNGTTDDHIVVSITRYPYRLFTPLIAGAFEGGAITTSISYEVP